MIRGCRPKMIEKERAAALSNFPWNFFDSLEGNLSVPFLFLFYSISSTIGMPAARSAASAFS